MIKHNTYTFIAVNYNNSNFTEKYINSVNEIEISESDEIKIIIVDNASDKNDIDKLEKICESIKNVKLIKSNENGGYFKGLNLGIIEAKKIVDRNLIVGNNDLTFDKQFIVNLKKINYNDKVMVIAPNIITKDGRQQNPHVVNEVSDRERFKNKVYFSNYYLAQILKLINYPIKKYINKKKKLTNEYGQIIIKRGIGACYILTQNFFQVYEKLDDSVFMWGEEAVLSHQVESAGGYTLYDPSIIIKHHESASVSSIQSKKKYYIVKESYKVYKDYL